MNQMAKHELGHTRTQGHAATRVLTWSVLGLALLVSACSTRVSRPAPVEDRGTSRSSTDTSAPAPAPAQPRVGYVTVQPGDTLYRIALNAGQDWRDIATWNNLPNPNAIEVGRVRNTRRVRLLLASHHPLQHVFLTAARALAP